MINKTEIRLKQFKRIFPENAVFAFGLDDWMYGNGWESVNIGFNNRLVLSHITGYTDSIYQNNIQGIVDNKKYRVVLYVFDPYHKNGTSSINIDGCNMSLTVVGGLMTYEGIVTGTTANGSTLTIIPSSDNNWWIYGVYIECLETFYPGSLDLYENQPLNLNFNINDIRDITKRNSTYSKTITIPATKNNNIIFNNIQDVNVYNNVSEIYLNKSIDAYLYQNNLLIKSGLVKLQKIIKEKDKPISYDIVFLSDVGNLITEIGDAYISNNEDPIKDTDLSALNHVFDFNTILGAWNSGDTLHYYYPLIDYTNGASNGSSAAYYNTLWTDSFNIMDLKPAISAKYLFDKILEEAGFTYDSIFLNSDPFINMILPGTGKIMRDVKSQLYKNRIVQVTTSTTNTSETWQNQKLRLNSVISDPNYQFDNVNYIINIRASGNYLFYLEIPYTMHHAGAITFYFKSDIPGTTGAVFDSVTISCPANMSYTNGVIKHTVSKTCQYNEKVYIWTNAVHGPGGTPFATWPVNSLTFRMTSVPDLQFFYEGDVVNMNSIWGDATYKKIDYITSIVKLFNLIIDEDSIRAKHFIIEPNDVYYSGGTFIDWTDKIDNDSEEINYLPEFWGQNVLLTGKQDDSDWYNRHYYNLTKKISGSQLIINPLLGKDTITIETMFSPTSIGKYGSGGLRVSKIFDADDPTIASELPIGIKTDTQFNMRILYYNNIPMTAPGTLLGLEFMIVTQNNPNAPYQISPLSPYFTKIAYAGHVDNPYENPYWDTYNFDFGTNLHYEIPFSGGTITFWNLYYLYYRDYLYRIMDQNAKLVTYYIKLNEIDMSTFRFNNTIRIKNAEYIVNKIVDWNPNQLCKVELLKLGSNYLKPTIKPGHRYPWIDTREDIVVKELYKSSIYIDLPYTPDAVGMMYVNSGDTIPYDTTDDAYYIAINYGKNQFSLTSNSIAQGLGNQMNDARNSLVQGDINIIGPGNNNIFIIGSKNYVKGNE